MQKHILWYCTFDKGVVKQIFQHFFKVVATPTHFDFDLIP
jgi:hypothetical protein